MGRLGVTVLRVYTILPPSMYQALEAYDRAHPDDPIYLVQGVYLPDESYVQTRDLYDPGPTRAFRDELRDASAAVHGDLRRDPLRGRASGPWTADVSPWLAAWLVGVEWDPSATAASDARNAAAPEHRGRYFSSRRRRDADDADRALARRAPGRARHGRGRRGAPARPWASSTGRPPTRSPTPRSRWRPRTSSASTPTTSGRGAWPGGTFASFHAYPYYPDFLRHQPGCQGVTAGGRPDPYAGYLAALQAALRPSAAADHRVRRAVLAGLGPPRARSAATRAATPSRRRWPPTPSSCG